MNFVHTALVQKPQEKCTFRLHFLSRAERVNYVVKSNINNFQFYFQLEPHTPRDTSFVLSTSERISSYLYKVQILVLEHLFLPRNNNKQHFEEEQFGASKLSYRVRRKRYAPASAPIQILPSGS